MTRRTPEQQAKRDAFIMAHYKKDMSVRELATELKTSPGNIVSRYSYLTGRRKGKRYFADKPRVKPTDPDKNELSEHRSRVTLPRVTLDRILSND